MTNTGFREISDIEEMKSAVEFAKRITKREKKLGYPQEIWEIDNIESFFKLAINEDNYKLLILEENNIEGIVLLKKIDKDKYLQTIGGIYFNSDYSYVLEKLINYLKNNCKGYELFIGYTKDSKSIIKSLSKIGVLIEELDFYNLNPRYFKEIDLRENIIELDNSNVDEFFDLHNRLNADMYWNSDRLREVLDDWKIYLYILDGRINAYVLGTVFKDNSAEIFTLSSIEKIKDNVFKELTWKISNYFVENNVEYIISTCESGDNEGELLKELNYKMTNDYILFKINI